MNDHLVRFALRLYPPAWRERYGAEIEQLIRDAAAHHRSAFAHVRIIADVARGGIGQRIAGHRRVVRGALMVSLCAGVVFPLDVVTLSSSPNEVTGMQVAPRPTTVLSASTKLAPGVIVLRLPASVAPLLRSAQPARVELEVVSHSNNAVSVDGPPSATVLNPNTGQLVSVKPIRRR